MSDIVISSVDDFQRQINQLNPDDSGLLYRGQAISDWPVNCSAARRLSENHIGQIERQLMRFPLVGYMDFLISKARMRQFLPPGKNTQSHDLEILAQLQHFGAATGLIDFTRQPSVALWFACNRFHNKNGAVYILCSSKTEELSQEGLEEKLESIYEDGALLSWEPAPSENRIVAQSSVFVLGSPEIESEQMTRLTIRAECKHEILTKLETSYGINEEMLNPDFPGYAVVNGTEHSLDIERTVSYWSNQIKQETCNSKRNIAQNKCGMAYLAIEKFKNAACHFDKVDSVDLDNADDYYYRGFTYASLNRHKDAITEVNMAISYSPNRADIYYLRGKSYASLGQHEEAIVDFNCAFVFQPNHPSVNYDLIEAMSKMGHYSKAGTVVIYDHPNGYKPIENWLSELTDRTILANIYASIDRLRSGNLRNSLQLSDELHELKINVDSRYLLYFFVLGEVTMLFSGGSRDNRTENIRNSQIHLQRIRDKFNMNKDTISSSTFSYNEWIMKQLSSSEESHLYLKSSVKMFEDEEDVEALLFTLRSVASALNHIQPASMQSDTLVKIPTEKVFKILDSQPAEWPKTVVTKLLEIISQYLPVNPPNGSSN